MSEPGRHRERFAKQLDVYAARVVAEERELMRQGAIEPIWPGPEPEPMEGDDDERSDDDER